MSAEVSDEDEREWSVVPSRSSKPVMRNGPSIADSKPSNSHVKRPRHILKGRSQERRERNKSSGTVHSDSTPSAVRLLRRPITKDDTDALCQSENASVTLPSTLNASNSSLQPGNRTVLDDDLKQKIGAPIIRKSSTQRKEETAQVTTESNGDIRPEKEHSLSSGRHGREGVKTHSGEEDGKLESSQIELGQSSPGLKRDKEGQPQKGGLLILPKKEPVTEEQSPPHSAAFDLASDEQWPSISGATPGSGRSGQRVWLHSRKGWNSIVKSSPVIKKKEATPPSSDEDENPVVSEDTRKKRRKKRKSGESVTHQPPQEKKLDTPHQLDIFQYMMQSPTRPILNRKEVKTSKEVSGNVLDSTAPVVRRGKEREVPKAKKPTPLRKIIDKEKATKRQLREQGQSVPPDLDVKRSESDPSDQNQHPPPTDKATPTFQPARGLHNKKFREYCSHMVTMEINSVVERLLQDLVRFQDRQHQRDPIRAKSKRRYVCGLREVYKHLGLGKLKCVIIPPNLDHIQSTGGIDERVFTILTLCHEKSVPVVFAMSRRRLARVLKKTFKMGCVGIFSYDGAEVHYKHLMKLVEAARESYQRVALRTAGRGSKEEEISTTQDPHTSDNSDAGDSLAEDDESLIPVPGNETVELPTDTQVMNTPWKIFFPQTPHNIDDITGSREPTNQIAGASTGQESVDSGHSTSHSTNQITENDGDVSVINPTNENTENGDVICQTNQKAQNSGDVIVDKGKQFRWNVYATEFKPSFV